MDLGSSPGEEKARELTFQLAAIERKQKEGTVGLRAASASWKGSEEGRPLLLHLIEREETSLTGVALYCNLGGSV